MLKNSRAISLTSFTLLGVAIFLLLKSAPSLADPPPAPAATTAAAPAAASTANLLAAPAATKINIDEVMKDRVIGNESAPVTIIEYASLTCPHCAHFDKEILPDLKKRLIDTGKAKLIYRDFPLDQFALKAAMMARCVSPLQYFNMIDVIFSNQERWTKAKDPLVELQKLGSLAGLDAADFKSCTENHDLETAILTKMQEAQKKYKAQSTPTFVFNDGAAQFTGAQPVDMFVETINKLPKGK